MGEIADLNEMTTLAINDYLLASDTSDATDKNKKLKTGAFAILASPGVAGQVASWLDANFVQAGGIAAANVALADGSRVIKDLKVGGSAVFHSPKVEARLSQDTTTNIGARFFARSIYMLNVGPYQYAIDACYLRAQFIVAAYEESANAHNSGGITVTTTPATLVLGTTTLTFSIASNTLVITKNTGTGVHLAVVGVSV